MTPTPAPWHYDPTSKTASGRIFGPDQVTVADLNHMRHEREANGRLIATAPELLIQLKTALTIDCGHTHFKDCNRACGPKYRAIHTTWRDLIARAEGHTP